MPLSDHLVRPEVSEGLQCVSLASDGRDFLPLLVVRILYHLRAL
jgi:hypothetical protein